MIQAKRIYTCDCGHQWREGHSGSHDCAVNYKIQRDALFYTAMRVIKSGHTTSLFAATLEDLRQVTNEIAAAVYAHATPPLYEVQPSIVRGHAVDHRLRWGAGDRGAEERAQVEEMIRMGISDPKRRAQLLEDMGQ